MFRRLSRQVGLLLSALLVAMPGTAMALPSQAPPETRRIVAVGDLHGDMRAWLDIARDAGLIDAHNRWAGGRTTLVQLGDITDRGPDSLKIIRDLQRLAARSRARRRTGHGAARQPRSDERHRRPALCPSRRICRLRRPRIRAARRDAFYAANRAAIEAAARTTRSSPEQRDPRRLDGKETPLGWSSISAAGARRARSENGRSAIRRSPMIGDSLFVHGGISAD